MKKILSTVAAAAVLATSSFAIDGMYGGVGVAIESVDPLDMGVALVLNGGAPIMKLGDGSLGAEGEFTYSIMAPSWDYNGYGGSHSVDISYMTLSGYAVWQYDINQQYFVKPRAGFTYISADGDGWDAGSTFGLSLGVHGGYKINKQLDAYLGIDLIDVGDMMHFTGGVQYHF